MALPTQKMAIFILTAVRTSSHSILKLLKSRQLRCVGYVAHLTERNAYTVLGSIVEKGPTDIDGF
jgi:hypothetical protein